ncbi:signal peptidase I [Gottfriedia acidiceleris]|uniref:signal peptidase I n=1 Tax=Gottfriedia acidiceleris TaxID=371036 RepID=UPI00101BF84B|nr:signal peptidase I [Gottfriedia acidiceleris]
MKKVWKWFSLLLVMMLVIGSGTVIYFFAKSKGNVEKVPSILGYKPLIVLSNSMKPTFQAGDLVLIKVNREPKLNDVVTYKRTDGTFITHRIVRMTMKDGKPLFVTKGDGNNLEDDGYVAKEHILGVETFSIPNVGYISKFFSSWFGFFLLIELPLLLVVILEIFQRLGIFGNQNETNVQH